MMDSIFLVVPKNVLPHFIREEDRLYFSKPVRVVVNFKVDNDIWNVTDPIRGHAYPACVKHLKRGWALTNKQIAAAKQAIEEAEKISGKSSQIAQ